jgi:tRNA(Ile2) C34 agmatinyltransferase TiaS
MKAKMPLKPPETGKYICAECNTRFLFVGGSILKCPRCGNATHDELVPIEMRDPEEDEFYTDDDFIGG